MWIERMTDKPNDETPEPSSTGAIYVDEDEPATLRYSEGLEIYPTLREARDAWLALSPEAKKGASITINRPDGARYNGLMIYRLWFR